LDGISIDKAKRRVAFEKKKDKRNNDKQKTAKKGGE
jgi:hypothetical protein